MNEEPLTVFAQVVDDFGMDQGDAFRIPSQFRHAQVADCIDFIGAQEVAGWDKWPGRDFVVQERKMTVRRYLVSNSIVYATTLTIYIRQV